MLTKDIANKLPEDYFPPKGCMFCKQGLTTGGGNTSVTHCCLLSPEMPPPVQAELAELDNKDHLAKCKTYREKFKEWATGRAVNPQGSCPKFEYQEQYIKKGSIPTERANG